MLVVVTKLCIFFTKCIFKIFVFTLQIASDSDLTGTIPDTIWQVMTARALHKMFKMNELHLVVSDKNLRLVDPSSQVNLGRTRQV